MCRYFQVEVPAYWRCCVGNFKRLMIGLLLFSGAGSVADAGPLVWTLQGVSFQGGNFQSSGSATGSFTFNADTQLLLTWNISVTGTSDPGLNLTYTPANSASMGNFASDTFRLVTPPSG